VHRLANKANLNQTSDAVSLLLPLVVLPPSKLFVCKSFTKYLFTSTMAHERNKRAATAAVSTSLRHCAESITAGRIDCDLSGPKFRIIWPLYFRNRQHHVVHISTRTLSFFFVSAKVGIGVLLCSVAHLLRFSVSSIELSASERNE
jgi:hypothetical protein